MEHNPTPSPKDMFKKFVQIGVVVADLDKSIQHLGKIFDIGPFRVIDWPPEGRSDIQKFYYGKPGRFYGAHGVYRAGPGRA